MTLDVTIDKITVDESQEEWVERCPDADHEICKKAYTLWTTESYRSGSTAFWEFWTRYCNKLYFNFRQHPNSNDKDTARLTPYIDEINALSDSFFEDETDRDRMFWFKYWANKAVEIYGDDAGIEFS